MGFVKKMGTPNSMSLHMRIQKRMVLNMVRKCKTLLTKIKGETLALLVRAYSAWEIKSWGGFTLHCSGAFEFN